MNIKHRVLLVSDMHYSTEETHAALKQKFPKANTSVAAGDAFGHTQREKIRYIEEAVRKEHRDHPLDAVLVLGDLSIDDYDFRNLPENYCLRFRGDCMKKFPCAAYAIAGNHDSYPDEMWRDLFGYNRQFSVRIGQMVFLMLDTFRETPATGASGSPYTPVDMAFLRSELEKYPENKIFLCAHYFNTSAETEAFRQVVKNDPRILGLFQGHTHKNKVLRPEEYGGKPLIDIGGYGYDGKKIDGKYYFNIFDQQWAWGYQIMEWDEETVHVCHCKPAYHYVGRNGVFDPPETLSGGMDIPLR